MVEGLPKGQRVRSMSGGRAHSVVVMEDGKAYGFGSNRQEQCGGRAEERMRARAQRIPGIDKVISVKCGLDHTVFLTEEGQVWTCGWGPDGQLGRTVKAIKGGETSAVQRVEGELREEKVIRIASSTDYSLALTEKGEVYAWGNNEYGQCGLGYKSDREMVGKKVMMTEPVVDMAAGSMVSLLLTQTCRLWSCGYGALGRMEKKRVLVAPGRVGGIERPKHLSATIDYCGVVDMLGKAYVWGLSGGSKRMGLGHEENQMEPVMMEFPSRRKGVVVQELVLGGHLSMALCAVPK
ncbi:MAG: regulator of chromosome condensation 1/beta-lactamase-inhibitor protein II [Piptocephalis tieghemiana]|nr:MAG: regulator of chromosome condensation 1/beta-lactamase-inhibitor protein II [Piptocephalis tieghemiana]